MLTLALLALVAAATATNLRTFDDGTLVQTNVGSIQGHINEAGIREFKGIPYALPPVGNLRWEYPQPAKSFEGTYVANFNAAGCPQLCNLPPGNCPAYGQSEDCLYLSVFAPPVVAKKPLKGSGYPVFFWIHGGAFEQGLGNCALYNGSTLAQQDLVIVTINYRLGALGYMAAENMQGNYGIMDQRLALQWVRDNIAAFGGDPDRITIGGQSAGAMSVGAHMTSPNSKGLFAGAIMESNPLALPFHSRESAAENADAAFEYLGCAKQDVECMRTKSVDAILEAQAKAPKLNLNSLFSNFLPWSPMVEENGEIPTQPFVAMAQGNLPTLPILAGSVLDEGQLFVYELFSSPLSESAYNIIVKGVFGARKAKRILDMYPFDLVKSGVRGARGGAGGMSVFKRGAVEGTGDGRDVLNVLATDLLFFCPLRNLTRGFQAKLGASMPPTYIYRFTHLESFDCWGENYTFCVGTVCHGSELPFVFNVFTDGASISYTPTSAELQLTQEMTAAWSSFVKAGNPNGGALPYSYPAYDGASDKVLVLDEPGEYVGQEVRDAYCDMWDELGYYY